MTYEIPNMKLGEYKGLQLSMPKVSLEEGEVEAKIKEFQRTFTKKEEADRPVQDGDIVTIDFTGYIDDEKFPGGEAQGYDLKIGSHSFIDTFEDQLIGHAKGETVDVCVTFPENYHAAELKGKPAKFVVVIHSVSEMKEPALDEEFVKTVTQGQLEDVDTFRASVEQQLLALKQDEARQQVENTALQMVTEATEADIPEELIVQETEAIMNEFNLQLAYQSMDLEKYCANTGTTMEALEAQARPIAEARVKGIAVLEAIIEAEGLDATEEEVENELNMMARFYQMPAEKLKEQMGDEQRAALKSSVCSRKALALILENAVIA